MNVYQNATAQDLKYGMISLLVAVGALLLPAVFQGKCTTERLVDVNACLNAVQDILFGTLLIADVSLRA